MDKSAIKSIFDLPNEILLNIFFVLSTKDIIKLFMVCHLLYQFINDEYVWKIICQKKCIISKQNLLSWRNTFKNRILIRSNLRNKKYHKVFGLDINTHSSFIDCQLYNHDKELLVINRNNKLVTYNLSNLINESQSTTFEKNRHNIFSTIFDRVRKIYIFGDLLMSIGNYHARTNKTSNVEISKIKNESDYKISLIQQSVLDTCYLHGIFKIGTVGGDIITIGSKDQLINIWDIESNLCKSSMTNTILEDTSAFNCEDKMIMVGTKNGLINIYDCNNHKSSSSTYNSYCPGLSKKIHQIFHDPNKNMIIYTTSQYFGGFDLRSSKHLFQQKIIPTKTISDSPSSSHLVYNFISHTQLFDGMIVWNSYYRDNNGAAGDLYISKPTNITSPDDKNSFTDVNYFRLDDKRLFISHYNSCRHSVYDLI